jgi:hypothetical protein
MPGMAAWSLLEHAVMTAPAAIADSAKHIILVFDIVFPRCSGTGDRIGIARPCQCRLRTCSAITSTGRFLTSFLTFGLLGA